MVAERDAWPLQREARIAALEATIFDREEALRKRQIEIGRREETIREREERISWLEDRIRRLETPRLPPRTNDLRVRIKDMVTRLPGWCSEEKAQWMANSIARNGYKIAAEVGVFAGRSLLPIALAIAANQGRAVYAVDAWDNAVATSMPTSERDDSWWATEDLVAAKSSFLCETVSQNFSGLIKIIELPSAQACDAIQSILGRSIDFLHIDGAHSEDQALSDVANWSELVSPGGMIVLDDIDWPSIRKAKEFLVSRFEQVAESRGDRTAFAAYRV
jgi:predicted O-methyltransferase YrrM